MHLHRVFGVITKKDQDHIICLFFAYSTTEDCEIYDPMVRFLRNFPQTTPLSPACPRSQQPRFPQFADLGFGSRDCTTFRTFECVCVCMCVCTSSVRDFLDIYGPLVGTSFLATRRLWNNDNVEMPSRCQASLGEAYGKAIYLTFLSLAKSTEMGTSRGPIRTKALDQGRNRGVKWQNADAPPFSAWWT